MIPQTSLVRFGFQHLPVLLLALFLAVPLTAQDAKKEPAPADATPATPAKPQPDAPIASTPADSPEDVLKLSPFEVHGEKARGYFAPNTLAGTRLNNNIADLPSSITVVTQQQLEDTASTNINDVFRYETNTEGAHTYTPFVLVRSNVQDSLGGGGGTTGNFTSALDTGNRVRGLSTVDQEEDNFFSLYRIPFDGYNTQAVEILRGPNSIIFGTGSPAGIVNQERLQAETRKLTAELTLTGGSWGTYRENLKVNIPLIQDRLGLFVAQLYDSEGFKQKPSSDITRRQYVALTAFPFKNHKTKLTASFENYNNYANDPNGITPVDFVTPWLNSGRPVWNPVTSTITYQATGQVVGPYAALTTSPNYTGILQTALTTATSPYFVPSLTYVANTHNIMFIDQGNLENFYRATQTGFSVPGWIPATLTPAQALINQQRTTITMNLPNPAGYATWYFPGVTSKSIYDWSTVNINSVNNTSTRALTYNVNLNQELLPDLNLQLGWFRQELDQLQDAPLAQANATTLYVDTNTTLPNGQANPHLGQPFVDVYSSDVYSQPENNNNLRAMLAYEPDLRDKVPAWLSWLGHHRFLGLVTQHDDVQTALRFRPAIIGGDPNYLPTAAALANTAGYSYAASNAAIEQWLYLGGATAGAPGYGSSSPGFYNRPGYGGATSPNITTYNYSSGLWNSSQINMDSLLFATGGLSENVTNAKTFFWESFLWDDRIVGSVGFNADKVKNRSTLFPATNPTAQEFTNGYANTDYWYKYGPWSYVTGHTRTLGVVARPFKNWTKIDASAERGGLLAGVVRTLGFTYNKSDNFNPPPAHYTDYFGNDLGKPQGKEKDYGVQIATPNGKFFLRATWFNSTNQNAIVTLTSTARANYIDQTELKNWATTVVEIRNGQNPSDPTFGNTSIHPITSDLQAQIAALTGLPYSYGGNVGATGEFVNPAANENGVAKGIDLELTYNPQPNWTMKFTWGKQQTTITGAAAQAQAWVNYRMPAWLQYAAADLPSVYTTSSGKKIYVGNFWNAYGFDGNIPGAGDPNGNTSVQAYYNVNIASQLAVDEANNGALAPNQREFHWAYLTNYMIDDGKLRGLSFGGAVRYDGRATAGYYGDTVHLNSAGQIAAPDINRPIYTPGKYHLDAWIAYAFKLPWATDRVGCKIQFNVQDLTSNGYLLPVSYNFDGSPAAERIIQPRTYTLSTKFSF